MPRRNLKVIPDTEQILNRILYMISKDVSVCEKIQSKKEAKWAALEPEVASKLINYARALKAIIEVQGTQRKKAKKLTDEQLSKLVADTYEAEKLKEVEKLET